MIITLDNVKSLSSEKYPILDRQIFNPPTRWAKYIIEEDIKVKLSNGDIIIIEKGFKWDKSSVPKILHSIFSPIGKFELAALIHDKIYVDLKDKYTRKFADKEMLIWSRALQGTSKISFRNFDNWFRYTSVRLLGWLAWKDII